MTANAASSAFSHAVAGVSRCAARRPARRALVSVHPTILAFRPRITAAYIGPTLEAGPLRPYRRPRLRPPRSPLPPPTKSGSIQPEAPSSHLGRIGAAGADDAHMTASPGVSERLPTLRRRARSSSNSGVSLATRGAPPSRAQRDTGGCDRELRSTGQQDGAQSTKRQCAQPSEPGRDRNTLKDTASPDKARRTTERRAEQHECARHRKS